MTKPWFSRSSKVRVVTPVEVRVRLHVKCRGDSELTHFMEETVKFFESPLSSPGRLVVR